MRSLHKTALTAAMAALWTAGSAVAAPGGGNGPPNGGGSGKPPAEPVGNNLSMPVIWGDGVALTIRNQPTLDDGTNAPTPADNLGDVAAQTTVILDGVTYYPQSVALNDWGGQTFSFPVADSTIVNVKEVDWGDNLESVDWRTSSPVRIEVVLYDKPGASGSVNPAIPALTGYPMRSLGGTKRQETFGTTGIQYLTSLPNDAAQNYEATIYSNCARLAIQRLLVPRDKLGDVIATWDGNLWSGADIVHENLLPGDGAVWQAGDGPGYFSSEVNGSGKLIYGVPWTVADYPAGASFTDYRITFELDAAGVACAPNGLKTSFALASIRSPVEEVTAAAEPTTGGVALIDGTQNISWIDIRVTSRTGGGGGGKGPNN